MFRISYFGSYVKNSHCFTIDFVRFPLVAVFLGTACGASHCTGGWIFKNEPYDMLIASFLSLMHLLCLEVHFV